MSAARTLLPCTLVAFVCLGESPRAAAADDAPRRPSDASPPPSCLDRSITDELGQALRPRGVQKRDFLKKYRAEATVHGGLYASDLLSSSYLWGGALAWFVTEDLGLEVSFDVTPVALDIDEPVGRFFGDSRFEPGTGYLGLASLLWSPVHFKLKTTGESILHGDAMFALGAGRLFHDTAQGLAFDGGLVIELYATSWLSLRFDLRDVLLVQEAVSETRLTHNLTARFGIGLWVPFGF